MIYVWNLIDIKFLQNKHVTWHLKFHKHRDLIQHKHFFPFHIWSISYNILELELSLSKFVFPWMQLLPVFDNRATLIILVSFISVLSNILLWEDMPPYALQLLNQQESYHLFIRERVRILKFFKINASFHFAKTFDSIQLE